MVFGTKFAVAGRTLRAIQEISNRQRQLKTRKSLELYTGKLEKIIYGVRRYIPFYPHWNRQMLSRCSKCILFGKSVSPSLSCGHFDFVPEDKIRNCNCDIAEIQAHEKNV
jgi:hypothetical protein